MYTCIQIMNKLKIKINKRLIKDNIIAKLIKLHLTRQLISINDQIYDLEENIYTS